MTRIEVMAPGALTTIQDLGRPGWAHIGVPRSGAADRDSLRLANHLVGNPERAAGLETTLTGPRLRFVEAAVVTLTGAPVPARAGDRQLPMNQPIELGAGEELRVGTARRGLRTYMAIAGGLDVPLVLGSAATDGLTGLGPCALAAGDVLRTADGRAGCSAGRDIPAPLELPNSVVLPVILGPRSDWFTDNSITRLLTGRFTVSPASNRIGLRLEGPALQRTGDAELRSEGLVPGAIQVPPDGQPILLLADHPTTGGYPVAAVVSGAGLRLAAQLRPGQSLGFSAEGGSHPGAARS